MDPVDPSPATTKPERRHPATDPSTDQSAAPQEQLARAQAQAQEFTTTVQDSRYTNKGSLVDRLA